MIFMVKWEMYSKYVIIKTHLYYTLHIYLNRNIAKQTYIIINIHISSLFRPIVTFRFFF